MARQKSPILTETELRLMDVLWEKGKATVSEVVAALSGAEKGPAYSTVLTMLRILTEKGYARHENEGRAYVYHPVVDRGEVRRRVIKYMVSRFFNNSPETLVLKILEYENIDAEDLDRLKRLVEDAQ